MIEQHQEKQAHTRLAQVWVWMQGESLLLGKREKGEREKWNERWAQTRKKQMMMRKGNAPRTTWWGGYANGKMHCNAFCCAWSANILHATHLVKIISYSLPVSRTRSAVKKKVHTARNMYLFKRRFSKNVSRNYNGITWSVPDTGCLWVLVVWCGAKQCHASWFDGVLMCVRVCVCMGKRHTLVYIWGVLHSK